MSDSYIFGILGGILSGAALHMLYLAKRRSRMRQEIESWKEVRMDRFLRLERLLQSEEIDQLSALPGFTKNLATKLETGRRRVLRLYLLEAEVSFNRLFHPALDYALNDPDAPEELAASLLQLKRKMFFAIPAVQVYLACRDLNIPVPRPAKALEMLEMAPTILGSTPAVARAASASF